MGRTRKSSVSEADAELVRILTETGKKEELRVRLMDQLGDPSCGWRDQVRHNGLKFMFNSHIIFFTLLKGVHPIIFVLNIFPNSHLI